MADSWGDKANLVQIFSKKLYVLPLNQRPYSWTKKQCEELFEDIADLPARKNLFLGSVILSDAKRTVRDQDHDQISAR